MTNQDVIWDYFQTQAQDSFSGAEARYEALVRFVEPGQTCLNVGVGNAGLERLAAQKRVDIHSLDPSATAINALRTGLGLAETHGKVGYSQEMPFADGQFDVVIMSEVLEHLDDEILQKTLAEVRRVLKSSGRFIGTVPADEALTDSIVVCPACAHVHHRWGHVQSFSEERLRAKLEQMFKVECVKRTIFVTWRMWNWKGKINRVLKKVMLALGSKGSEETFFFIARASSH